jgi:transposase
VNAIRGLLNECGITIPQNIQNVGKNLPEIIENANNEITSMGRDVFTHLYEELKNTTERIVFYESKIKTIAAENETCKRIQKIEGVGIITATAIAACIGDPNNFENGRQVSAWLGLVPRQNSSGGKSQLLGISKRGDSYLRCLLIHGARAVIRHAKNKTDPRTLWINEKEKINGFNKIAVTLANKNARIIWALMLNGSEYKAA